MGAAGASANLAWPLAAAAGRATGAASARAGGFAGVIGAAPGALATGGATAGADGGALCASGRTTGGTPDATGGTVGGAGGVGLRPGANGGTRVGVALRGEPAGGVKREPAGPTDGRDSPAGCNVAPDPPNADAVRDGAAVRLAASCGVAKSSVQLRALVMGMIPPHTEHRARTPGPGTREGSTRNTEWHSGHETFMTRRLG
jgi:hypothetical protein